LESDWIDLGGDDGDAGEQCDEGKPPDVSPEEFAGLDQATGYEEISRLPEMKVIHEPSARDLEEGTISQQGVSWICASEIKSGNADVAMWHVNSEVETEEWLLHLLQRQELVQDWFW